MNKGNISDDFLRVCRLPPCHLPISQHCNNCFLIIHQSIICIPFYFRVVCFPVCSPPVTQHLAFCCGNGNGCQLLHSIWMALLHGEMCRHMAYVCIYVLFMYVCIFNCLQVYLPLYLFIYLYICLCLSLSISFSLYLPSAPDLVRLCH